MSGMLKYSDAPYGVEEGVLKVSDVVVVVVVSTTSVGEEKREATIIIKNIPKNRVRNTISKKPLTLSRGVQQLAQPLPPP